VAVSYINRISPKPRLCLISMPFFPLLMPALGISILKSVATAEGYSCDVYYGAFELFRDGDSKASREMLIDYSFVSTVEDLGDLLFTPVLWPEKRAQVLSRLSDIPISPYAAFSADQTLLMVARIMDMARHAEKYIERCVAARDWSSYDIVGFSTTFSQNIASLCLARRIREVSPSTTIVFGGANCDGVMGQELLRSFPWVDHVLSGEAEASFAAYLKAMSAGREPENIPGLHRRDPGRASGVESTPARVAPMIDAVPEPDFSDYFAQLPTHSAAWGEFSLPMELSRGCWWGAIQHCVFCGLNPNGMTFRSQSPSVVVERLTSAAARWGIRNIFIVDNILNLDYLTSVMPLLEGQDLQIFCETKSNLSEVQVAQLQRSGVTKIQAGIESLNTNTLKHMRKGARAATQIELLKWCTTYQVRPLWFYLYGFPGEDEAWYLADIAMMSRLVHLPPPGNPNPVVVDRYSPLFREPEKFGIGELRPAWNNKLVYAGLADEARANLTYHFDADALSAKVSHYEQLLWATVAEWQHRFGSGAYLVQRASEHTTLVEDGRIPSNTVTYVLTGAAHEIWQAMRRATTLATLVERLRAHDRDNVDISWRDIEITLSASVQGAHSLTVEYAADAPDDHERAVREFVSQLDERALVVRLDGRWLALAVDSSPLDATDANERARRERKTPFPVDS